MNMDDDQMRELSKRIIKIDSNESQVTPVQLFIIVQNFCRANSHVHYARNGSFAERTECPSLPSTSTKRSCDEGPYENYVYTDDKIRSFLSSLGHVEKTASMETLRTLGSSVSATSTPGDNNGGDRAHTYSEEAIRQFSRAFGFDSMQKTASTETIRSLNIAHSSSSTIPSDSEVENLSVDDVENRKATSPAIDLSDKSRSILSLSSLIASATAAHAARHSGEDEAWGIANIYDTKDYDDCMYHTKQTPAGRRQASASSAVTMQSKNSRPSTSTAQSMYYENVLATTNYEKPQTETTHWEFGEGETVAGADSSASNVVIYGITPATGAIRKRKPKRRTRRKKGRKNKTGTGNGQTELNWQDVLLPKEEMPSTSTAVDLNYGDGDDEDNKQLRRLSDFNGRKDEKPERMQFEELKAFENINTVLEPQPPSKPYTTKYFQISDDDDDDDA